jgi:hypothetical protein
LRLRQDLRAGVFANFVTVSLGVTHHVRDEFIVIVALDYFAARRTYNLLRHRTTPFRPGETPDLRDGDKSRGTTQGARVTTS